MYAGAGPGFIRCPRVVPIPVGPSTGGAGPATGVPDSGRVGPVRSTWLVPVLVCAMIVGAAVGTGGVRPDPLKIAAAMGAPAPPRGDPPAPPPGAGVPAPGAGYAWPLLPPPPVVTPFRAPEHAYGPGHRGVDLAGAVGQPVLAARAGAVVFAGPLAGRGVVSVQHDDGLRTTYEPVRPVVAGGAAVQAGDVVGLLEPGHPGCVAPCLHWGVRRDRTEYLDPLVLLRPPRVRLLPVPVPWPLDPA